MNIEKFTTQSCCGKTSVIFKTDQPLTKDIMDALVKLGFKLEDHFLKAGIIYAINDIFIVTGPIGSDRLQIKCKKDDCAQKLNDFEALLKTI